MNTTDMDSIIRKRAERQLLERAERCVNLDVDMRRYGTILDARGRLIKAIVTTMTEQCQQAAVEDFVAKLDRLGNEVEAMRSSVAE